jgi:hypothetical protein
VGTNCLHNKDPQHQINAHAARKKRMAEGHKDNEPLASRSVGHVELLRMLKREREEAEKQKCLSSSGS